MPMAPALDAVRDYTLAILLSQVYPIWFQNRLTPSPREQNTKAPLEAK